MRHVRVPYARTEQTPSRPDGPARIRAGSDAASTPVSQTPPLAMPARRPGHHLVGDIGDRRVFQFRYPSYGEIAMRIAVAGGTGMVGKYVVEAITGAGHDAVVLSRSRGVDLRTDSGLAHALDGVEVIVDAANPDSISGAKATAFFTDVTARLQSVGFAHGVARLVTLSIVGIDRVPDYGYYRAKLAQEAVATAGPVPVTIVRATQFHEFPAQILGRARFGPLAAMPVMRVQPVAAPPSANA